MTIVNKTETLTRVENFLAHYGVLGMKWGVRKDDRQRSSGYQSKKRKKKVQTFKPGTHPEHRQAHTLEKKPVHQLSTNQIKQVNARLEAEKKLNQLKAERSTIRRGENHIKTITALIATATAAGAAGAGLYRGGARFIASPRGQQVINRGRDFLASSGLIRRSRAGRAVSTAVQVLT